jgi:hypothetical protein
MIKNSLIIVIGTLTMQSCYITESIPNRVLITKLADIKCDSLDSTKTFFSYYNGEKIDFEYTPISMITVSNGNQSQGNMLMELKQNALSQCADGLINIGQDINEGKYKQEDLWDNKNTRVEYKTYNIQKYTGLAVKLKDKSTAKIRVDSLYYNELELLNQKLNQENINSKINDNKSKSGTVVAIFAAIAVIGTFILYEAVILR